MTRPARLLILGGTGEAAALAHAMDARFGARLDIITSLAGRTDAHPHLPGRVRVGGFGGPEGLCSYLRAQSITCVIDATHPFAFRMSLNAEKACALAGIPRLALVRPPWYRHVDDHWIEVETMAEAAARLPAIGRRAFLAVGRQELDAFAETKGVRFLVRLIAPMPLVLADATVVFGRGPFRVEDEIHLLWKCAADVVVTKASGGEATYAKIAAARELSLPVLMVHRPPSPGEPSVDDIGAAVEWVAAVTSGLVSGHGCDPAHTAGSR